MARKLNVIASLKQAGKSQADSLGSLRFLGSASLPSRRTWVAQFWGRPWSLPATVALAPALECHSALGWHVKVNTASTKPSAPCVPVWCVAVKNSQRYKCKMRACSILLFRLSSICNRVILSGGIRDFAWRQILKMKQTADDDQYTPFENCWHFASRMHDLCAIALGLPQDDRPMSVRFS